MATPYAATDQFAGQVATYNSPNFVGELFKLSPLDTPLLSMIGGLTGGRNADGTPVFTWQDTLHRAPALQSVAEGSDATFSGQRRRERRNVVAIHQYGVETNYTKAASVGLLGSGGASPTVAATSILGNQPIQDEHSAQVQVKIEQAALDVELMFLTGTFAWPSAGQARQSQGIIGWIGSDTTTDWTGSSGHKVDRDVINDLSKKLYDNGAPMQNVLIMVNSLGKLELGQSYSQDTTGGAYGLQPRDRNVFGVNITDVVTEFGTFAIVLNRHLNQNTVLMLEMGCLSPRFLPIPGKGHFFIEPLAKSGAYDRDQLYGEIGLELGPAGWHAKAINLHA